MATRGPTNRLKITGEVKKMSLKGGAIFQGNMSLIFFKFSMCIDLACMFMDTLRKFQNIPYCGPGGRSRLLRVAIK